MPEVSVSLTPPMPEVSVSLTPPIPEVSVPLTPPMPGVSVPLIPPMPEESVSLTSPIKEIPSPRNPLIPQLLPAQKLVRRESIREENKKVKWLCFDPKKERYWAEFHGKWTQGEILQYPIPLFERERYIEGDEIPTRTNSTLITGNVMRVMNKCSCGKICKNQRDLQIH